MALNRPITAHCFCEDLEVNVHHLEVYDYNLINVVNDYEQLMAIVHKYKHNIFLKSCSTRKWKKGHNF